MADYGVQRKPCERGCGCQRCYKRAVRTLAEAESATRALREKAIQLIAAHWTLPERAVVQALAQRRS